MIAIWVKHLKSLPERKKYRRKTRYADAPFKGAFAQSLNKLRYYKNLRYKKAEIALVG